MKIKQAHKSETGIFVHPADDVERVPLKYLAMGPLSPQLCLGIEFGCTAFYSSIYFHF